MLFTINNSPFFGKEGKICDLTALRDRLYKEIEKNLGTCVLKHGSPDSYLVLAVVFCTYLVLIETMRREGYELQVGQPQVIIKEINGVKHEPFETLTGKCTGGMLQVKSSTW